MGQRLSRLKKAREVTQDVQTSSAPDAQSGRTAPPEEKIVVSSSNGIESNQSSFIDDSPEALHVSHETEIQITPVALPNLPTELILAVAHYLPPSNYMSLSYSCRTIHDKMGVSIAHVVGDKVPMGQHSGCTLSAESRNVRFL